MEDDSQEGVRDAVDEPGDAEVEPGKVPVHLGREDGGEEDGEEADRAGELEGEEELDLGEVLAAQRSDAGCSLRGFAANRAGREGNWARGTHHRAAGTRINGGGRVREGGHGQTFLRRGRKLACSKERGEAESETGGRVRRASSRPAGKKGEGRGGREPACAAPRAARKEKRRREKEKEKRRTKETAGVFGRGGRGVLLEHRGPS